MIWKSLFLTKGCYIHKILFIPSFTHKRGEEGQGRIKIFKRKFTLYSYDLKELPDLTEQ